MTRYNLDYSILHYITTLMLCGTYTQEHKAIQKILFGTQEVQCPIISSDVSRIHIIRGCGNLCLDHRDTLIFANTENELRT